ncbi:MAG: aldose 1-epimerase family protein [Clostridiales bacterium]|nr:aldose 1-epimerase family protein [Clostridiales bacterium]
MVAIKNDSLTVEISEVGAELQSIKDSSGREWLWQGDPQFWTGRAPICFPICGGLKEDRFIYKGKSYTLSKHGFARKSIFEVVKINEDSAVFELKSNENTKEMYPFDFVFRAKYKLKDNSLEVTYSVKNTGEDIMFFSVGAHEAYATPEGIENYKVVFDLPETLRAYILDGNLLEHNYVTLLENKTEFPLLDRYFAVDALVFKHLNSHGVTLINKSGDRKINVKFDGFDYFLLWHKHGAPYICLEPWAGIQDPVDSDFILEHKEGINYAVPGETFKRTHLITFG